MTDYINSTDGNEEPEMDNEALVIQNESGDIFTTSLILAEGTSIQHKNVLELIRKNSSDFEEFGGVAFETRPFETPGGTQYQNVALLNRDQALLAMTYMRNTDIVRDFKKRLVRAFSTMEKMLAERIQPQLDGKLLLAKAVIEAQAMIEANEQRIKELEPKASAWDVFVNSDGDMSVADAAHALTKRIQEENGTANIGRNQLFEKMREYRWATHCHGYWEPMQYALNQGYLVARENMPMWKRNGESFLPHPTIRVTARGLDRLWLKLNKHDLPEVA